MAFQPDKMVITSDIEITPYTRVQLYSYNGGRLKARIVQQSGKFGSKTMNLELEELKAASKALLGLANMS